MQGCRVAGYRVSFALGAVKHPTEVHSLGEAWVMKTNAAPEGML